MFVADAPEQIPPKRDLYRVDVIPNWTPASDFVITTPSSHQLKPKISSSIEAYQRSRIFACNSRLNYGSITELRHGMNVWIKLILPYHLGANRIWTFQGPMPPKPQKGSSQEDDQEPDPPILLIISFSLHTEVLQISESMKELTVEQKSEADTRGLNFGARTLAAGIFESSIVQITPNGISAIDWLSHDRIVPAEASLVLPVEDSIIEACLELDTGSIVTVVRKQDQILLGLISMQTENRCVGAHSQPKEQALTEHGTSHIIFCRVGESLNLLSHPSHLTIVRL